MTSTMSAVGTLERTHSTISRTNAPVTLLAVDAVVFRKDLYPRFTPDAATIQRYEASLEALPPIEVNQHNELIDGYHRWHAHREVGRTELLVMVTPTASDDHLLDLAIDRNAKHGMQLSMKEEEHLAGRLYRSRQRSEAELVNLLSVSDRVMRDWLAGEKRAEKEKQQADAFDLWLACHTQEEIADLVALAQQTVADWLKELPEMANLPNPVKLAALFHDEQWTRPLYTVLTFAKDDDTAADHFGNSHSGILDRLVYLYTEPFEIVVDPFAGAGSTADICRKRSRRYWCADRKVKAGLAEQKYIRTADIADGPPRLPWSDVALVYLDPPYWKQAAGKYSDDPQDLANMPLEDFYSALTTSIKATARKMRKGAHIALLMQPTQWNNEPTREVIDHVFDLAKRLDGGRLRLKQRISCPYSTQQATPQMVEWAKANKQLLVISRECMVFEVV